MREMSPSRPQGCVQANYQQLIPNLQFRHCIMHKLQIEVKKCFGKGFGWICALNKWSVQECTQTSFLPCSSSGIALFGMRSVQADSCLNSEHIDALCISVGGQEGVGSGKSAACFKLTNSNSAY